MEIETLFSWAPKSLWMLTAALKIKWMLLGRKVMTKLDSILKGRDITLPTEVHLVKAMIFPVVMYGCESWTIKKTEHRRTDAFELWSWRRLLRVPWTTKRSNQSILQEISPECSLEVSQAFIYLLLPLYDIYLSFLGKCYQFLDAVTSTARNDYV